MEYLDSTHSEWDSMWQELASYDINNGDPLCIHQGLCWEYMGSTDNHHNFRHSRHPATGRIEHVYIERYQSAIRWA
ncbi:hypothetical protein KOI40_17440 [Aestuariicella sp. G3-2]|uniref:hypothetical protein n=1 Tax=Pseudomaricurvus albidus TaxID=2842452 RepID=UPI001C0C64CF|nr:hypothetical protein [Aestuariicella albida]MBU3071615.1 hypothetical protein [Aestuariicella albida]